MPTWQQTFNEPSFVDSSTTINLEIIFPSAMGLGFVRQFQVISSKPHFSIVGKCEAIKTGGREYDDLQHKMKSLADTSRTLILSSSLDVLMSHTLPSSENKNQEFTCFYTTPDTSEL